MIKTGYQLDNQSSLPMELIGEDLDKIPTPALLVDLPTLRTNLATMQEKVSRYGKALRPHIKTHKCGQVARMQVEAGATGVTCATVGEAEAMAAAGIRDILIANQIVTPEKLLRLVPLVEQCNLKFAVDSLLGIEMADKTAQEQNCRFEVLVEVDSGGNRCGVQSPDEAAGLVRRILESPALKFGGIQAYFGGTSYIKDMEERQRAVDSSDQILAKVLEAVRYLTNVSRVSGAGTGNSICHLQNNLLTEIQSGSYVYSDTTYQELAPEYSPALFILATTISRPVRIQGYPGCGAERDGNGVFRSGAIELSAFARAAF